MLWTPFALFQSTREADFEVNLKNDVSAVEYELK